MLTLILLKLEDFPKDNVTSLGEVTLPSILPDDGTNIGIRKHFDTNFQHKHIILPETVTKETNLLIIMLNVVKSIDIP